MNKMGNVAVNLIFYVVIVCECELLVGSLQHFYEQVPNRILQQDVADILSELLLPALLCVGQQPQNQRR